MLGLTQPPASYPASLEAAVDGQLARKFICSVHPNTGKNHVNAEQYALTFSLLEIGALLYVICALRQHWLGEVTLFLWSRKYTKYTQYLQSTLVLFWLILTGELVVVSKLA